MHSTHSDGTLSTHALVHAVHAAGVSAFSLTDHDTVAGIAEATSLAAALGLRTLPGIELSTELDGLSVHMLGYAFDPADAGLTEMLARLRHARHARIPRLVARLGELGAPITEAQVMAVAGEGNPGRPHVARALVDAGHCRDLREAFARYLGDGRPAHIRKPVPTPSQAIAAIRAAGGVPVWAHPLARPPARPGGVERLARELAADGLGGLEVIHPAHSPGARRKLRALCNELGLIETGGSDFHGTATPDITLGRGRGQDSVPVAAFEALQAAG